MSFPHFLNIRSFGIVTAMALSNLTITTSADAGASFEFLSCEFKGSGSWAGCKIYADTYLFLPPFERTAKVDYDFSCSPGKGDRFAVVISDGEKKVAIPMGSKGTVTLDSSREIHVFSESPTRLYNANLNPGCHLTLTAEEIGPTAAQIATWHKDAQETYTEWGRQEKVISHLYTLAKLIPAYKILGELVKNLDTSLRANSDLVATLKDDTIKMALLSLSLSTDDMQVANAISGLMKKVDRMVTDDTTDDVLSRSLSAEDLAIIQQLSVVDLPDIQEVNDSIAQMRDGYEALGVKFMGICTKAFKLTTIPNCPSETEI